MEKQVEPKKIKWNIAKTMAVVCNTLRKSKLNIRKSQNYTNCIRRSKKDAGALKRGHSAS